MAYGLWESLLGPDLKGGHADLCLCSDSRLPVSSWGLVMTLDLTQE